MNGLKLYPYWNQIKQITVGIAHKVHEFFLRSTIYPSIVLSPSSFRGKGLTGPYIIVLGLLGPGFVIGLDLDPVEPIRGFEPNVKSVDGDFEFCPENAAAGFVAFDVDAIFDAEVDAKWEDEVDAEFDAILDAEDEAFSEETLFVATDEPCDLEVANVDAFPSIDDLLLVLSSFPAVLYAVIRSLAWNKFQTTSKAIKPWCFPYHIIMFFVGTKTITHTTWLYFTWLDRYILFIPDR